MAQRYKFSIESKRLPPSLSGEPLLVLLSNIVEHCRFNNKELDIFVLNDKGLDNFVFNDNIDNDRQYY